MDSTAIRFGWFLAYKFFNSLFLGLSIGAVFTLYEPLSPAIFSAGGIGLALATLVIATQYHRLFNPEWFYRLSITCRTRYSFGCRGGFALPIRKTSSTLYLLGLPIHFCSRQLSCSL